MRASRTVTAIFVAGSLLPVLVHAATPGTSLPAANDALIAFVPDAGDRIDLVVLPAQDQTTRIDGVGLGANNFGATAAGTAAGASVSGTKTVSGDLWPGGLIIYQVMLSNAGPGNQNDNPGDEFVDVLPPEIDLTGASAIAGVVTSDPASNTVTWNGPIPAYTSISIEISAVVGSATPGMLVSNQGTIRFDGDGNGSNETQVGTDDPTLPGATDPTEFTVDQLQTIPTLGMVGLLTLAGMMAVTGIALLRSQALF
jgi:hypothetical protein